MKIVDRYFNKFANKKSAVLYPYETQRAELDPDIIPKTEIIENFNSILFQNPEIENIVDLTALRQQDQLYGRTGDAYAWRDWNKEAQNIASTLEATEEYNNLAKQLWSIIAPQRMV